MKRLKDLREDHDLKQADIAKILGISQQYYQCYESGKHELPLRHCIKLAEYYNISVDYLLELSELPQTAKQQAPFIEKHIKLIQHFENAAPEIQKAIKILLNME